MMLSPSKLHAPARPVPYAKMNGIGNAILVVDLRDGAPLDAARARQIAETRGFGFDQLMALRPPRSSGAEAYVDIYNRDGSLAGACGNGTRCVAWFLLRDSLQNTLMVETEAGPLDCTREAEWVFSVDMGAPRTGWRDIPLREPVADTRSFALTPAVDGSAALGPASAVSMGNPHVVFWIDPAAAPLDLPAIGPALEHHPMFPERANISFARVRSRDRMRLDVWERGAGVTRACGSAACAALVAAVRTGRMDRRAEVELPGGTLSIEWREADEHVLMTGPVELERLGELPPDLADPAR